MKTACPFCKKPFVIDLDGVDKDIRCSECDETFCCAIVTTPKIGTMYLDIETTASPENVSATISTITWWCDQKWLSWVNGRDDPAKFLMYWKYSETLVTYNGKTFDEPKIMRHFRVGPHRNHIDLMHMARGRDLTGGLKKIGMLCAFPRPPELDNVDGSVAIKLWKKFLYCQEDDALQNLLYYNAWDVALTYYLHNHLMSTRASSIHEDIPFHLNFESMSSMIPKPRRVPSPRKAVGNILEYWAERKKNPLTILRDAEVCITGDLSCLEREEALSVVARLGGTPKNAVTRTLDFLVVGADAGHTKVFAAEMNIQNGSHLRMITEADFLELIKHTEQSAIPTCPLV